MLSCTSGPTISFLQGGSHPEELVERAAELGLTAIALTDRDGLYGAVRFSTYARQRGVEAIVGSELTFEDGAHIVLLVENERGYAHLCELISRRRCAEARATRVCAWKTWRLATTGLIALSGGPFGRVERALAQDGRACGGARSATLERALRAALLPRAPAASHARRRRSATCSSCGSRANAGCRTSRPTRSSTPTKTMRWSPTCSRCVRDGTTLQAARAANQLRPNAEFHLKAPAAMRRLFAEYPEAIERSVAIARRCSFRLERLDRTVSALSGAGGKLAAALPSRARLRRRRPAVRDAARDASGTPARIRARLDRQDGSGRLFFDRLGYRARGGAARRALPRAAARRRTRRSATRLGITAVDPIGMDLLFERFMSEERREIPDIDIDFAHQDREQRDSIRLRALRAHECRDGGRGHHVSNALGDPRRRQGAGLELWSKSTRSRASSTRANRFRKRPAPELLFAICRRIANFPRHLGHPFRRHADHARSAGTRRAGRMGDDARSHRRSVG